MKSAALALAAMFAGALLYATTATGGQQTSPSRAEFNAIKKRVASLEKSNKALLGYTANCLLNWQAITKYGPGGTSGYVYAADANNIFLVSALNFTETGDAPSGYVVFQTGSSCTTAATANLRRLVR